jgi:tetratricopeptide (TPR) repeat protein
MRIGQIKLYVVAVTFLLVDSGTSATGAQQGRTQPSAAKVALEHYNDGVRAYSQGKYDEGIAAFTSVIKARAGTAHGDAYYGRGVCYNRKKEYAKAVADFNEALKVKPNLGEAYIERAAAYAGLGKFQEALADYTGAMQKGANKSEVIKFRGSLYFQMKDYDKAIADWKAYMAAVPNAKGAEAIHYNIGLAYLAKKEYEGAVEAFTAALEIRPGYAAAHSGRAEAYLGVEPKKYREALADAQAALRADPSDEYAKRFLEQAKAGLGID